MNTSKIEWLRDPITGKAGYTINPVRGLCPVACPYCYARRMYKRFHRNETIRYEPEAWTDGYQNISRIKEPSKIFVGSTFELFGEWVKHEWLEDIFSIVKRFPQHTFIFLTKRPENLIKWSPFPENCWVGVSATNNIQLDAACAHLSRIKASVRFVSLEPFLDFEGKISNGRFGWQEHYHDINWLIIGQQTPVKASTSPKIEWIKEIVEAADKANVPVFLKNNLAEAFKDSLCPFPKWAFSDGYYTDDTHPYVDLHLRQEYPVRDRRNQ